MILTLERRYKKDMYTIGILYVDGVYFANTIEDRDRGIDQSMPVEIIRSKKVPGYTAIPTGTYRIDMNTISPKFKNRDWAKPYGGRVPRLKEVPGFTGILIHPFNTAEESKGCIAVGLNKVKGKVVQSTYYFKKLMGFLTAAHNRGEDIMISIQ